MQAMAGGAEVVFWGSAYGGGSPLRSAALMHNYAIVSSGWGEFIGSNGVDVAPDRTMQPQADATVRIATLDLDATMVNFVSLAKLLRALSLLLRVFFIVAALLQM
jgi:hypothetical protein